MFVLSTFHTRSTTVALQHTIPTSTIVVFEAIVQPEEHHLDHTLPTNVVKHEQACWKADCNVLHLLIYYFKIRPSTKLILCFTLYFL